MEREPPTLIKASDIFCQGVDCFFTMIKPAKLMAMQTRVLERDSVKKKKNQGYLYVSKNE